MRLIQLLVVIHLYVTMTSSVKMAATVYDCPYDQWDLGDNTGFQCRVRVTVCEDLFGGWSMNMKFSSDVYNLWPYSHVYVENQVSESEYVLSSVDYTHDMFVSESPYEFDFEAAVAGSTIPTVSVTVVDSDGSCGDGSSTTSAPETTTGGSGTTTTQGSGSSTISPGKYDYNDALHKSILFYEAQRSGYLPDTNRISWRGNSALGDGSDVGLDLTGGWYDAGDHVKFNFPQTYTVTALSWGVLEFWDAYVAAGELDNVMDSIKWPLDFLVKCHPSANVFYGQLGEGHADHAFWGRPEDMTMYRPAYSLDTSQPGSDLAAEAAAAMAAGSLIFKKYGWTDYASNLLTHAIQLYDFAYSYRGVYSDSITNAADFYKSWSGYNDELAWGALWLYKATSDSGYMSKAEEFYPEGVAKLFSWDDKNVGSLVLFHALSTSKQSDAESKLSTFLNNWIYGEGGITITPQGLSWGDQWGPLRYSANSAMIALIAAKQGIRTSEAQAFALKQIDYMLGDTGHSFVCGFGVNPPLKPHHRGSSCPTDPSEWCDWDDYNSSGPNPNTLTGALVGGPDEYDNWEDDRSDYITNEVATDYNAGFQSALAGVIELHMN